MILLKKISMIQYSKLWKIYINVSRGKIINVKEISVVLKLMKSLEYAGKAGGVLLVFNSGRLADRSLLQDVSIRRHGLDGENISLCQFNFADVKISGYLENEFSLRLKSLKWMILHLPSFLIGMLKGHSMAAGMIRVYQRVFLLRGITKLELFTSNNRLTELIRMAAIASGLQVTEYLHGICSDVFSDYYRLIHQIAADGQLGYVNMAPGLPQPDIIRDNLLRHGALEVFFQNEAEWLPYEFSRSSDVLIVGSDVPDGNYWKSSLFENDLSLMNFCLSEGLKVVYCAHPLIYENAKFNVPKNVRLGRFRDYINSTKVLVGHYSTALFTAHLIGKNILIFKDSFDLIPGYFFRKFIDANEVVFSEEKLLVALKVGDFVGNINDGESSFLGLSLKTNST